MIPWFNIEFPSIPFPIIGKLTIHAFGILVAIGIIVGLRLTKVRGRELGLVDERVDSMVTWALVIGFIVAHLFDVFAYQTFGKHPSWADILNPIAGLSSFGGFTGALIGLFIWCRRHHERVMPYADSLAYGLATGWMFGRLGCFTAHDHPGSHTSFFLAVRYPDGPRHDLGLYEAIWAACISLWFAWLRRKKRPLGTYVAILTLAYAPVRFGLDFLRAHDVPEPDARYLGLTPAQWGCIGVLVAGIALSVWVRRHAHSPPTVV
ncbi:MAG: Prolipoprotein diacylglyceryl transferase [Myxococcales bacterium]|nr:Prolipoprotein diacylglyceryl transferase [Myxococcales bacterium]